MKATLRAFRAEYYLRLSDWLKVLGWLADWNPLMVRFTMSADSEWQGYLNTMDMTKKGWYCILFIRFTASILIYRGAPTTGSVHRQLEAHMVCAQTAHARRHGTSACWQNHRTLWRCVWTGRRTHRIWQRFVSFLFADSFLLLLLFWTLAGFEGYVHISKDGFFHIALKKIKPWLCLRALTGKTDIKHRYWLLHLDCLSIKNHFSKLFTRS